MSLSTEPLKILVVDDDSHLVRTLVDILRMNGHHLTGASNGRQGLDLVEHLPGPLAVALVDLRLPDMGGMELVGKLHALSGQTEVVILTGNASVDSAVKALREQMDQLSEIITIATPDGTIQYQSPAIHRVLGYDAEARVQESVFDSQPGAC